MRLCMVAGCGGEYEAKGLCFKHYKKEYDAANREKQKKYQADRYLAGKERLKAVRQEYYKTNKEAFARRFKKWQKANPEVAAANAAKRRADRLQATPAWADLKQIERIYKECPVGHDVDHYYPLKSDFVCGLHVPDNLQYLPSSVNRSKGNRVAA